MACCSAWSYLYKPSVLVTFCTLFSSSQRILAVLVPASPAMLVCTARSWVGLVVAYGPPNVYMFTRRSCGTWPCCLGSLCSSLIAPEIMCDYPRNT